MRRTLCLPAALLLNALNVTSSFAQEEIVGLPSNEFGSQRRCSGYNAAGNVYFGDLHVHSSYSFDAAAWGTQRDPAQVYAHASGLEFAAVTDHAKYLGETAVCTNPASAGYDSQACVSLRAGSIASGSLLALCRGDPPQIDPAICAEALDQAWSMTQAAANAADRPCEFTAFIGYEYGLQQGLLSLHRNVIFASRRVVEQPISQIDQPTAAGLWQALADGCDTGAGCDVLTIPHNGNGSFGYAFAPFDIEDEPLTPEIAALRASMEPLAEIYQNKGSSECYPGIGNSDEDCMFEQLPLWLMGPIGQDPPRLSFVREGLKEGLLQRELLGVNPFQLGVIASTDTHNGVPGVTDERRFAGHVGILDDTFEKRLSGGMLPSMSPGGLAAVWAPQNTRSDIFSALRRREAYGTSGTRLRVRFFGGWQLPAALCEELDPVTLAYAHGVPMGAELRAPNGADPSFLVISKRDPLSAGLAEIHIIKGWYDGSVLRERVYVVAESALADGAASLCVQWTDEDFDLAHPVFYYARVLESPTRRWSAQQCEAAGGCSEPAQLPSACCNGDLPELIRERAWTSPIWYQP